MTSTAGTLDSRSDPDQVVRVQFVLVHVAYIQANFQVGAFYWARSLILTPYLGT